VSQRNCVGYHYRVSGRSAARGAYSSRSGFATRGRPALSGIAYRRRSARSYPALSGIAHYRHSSRSCSFFTNTGAT
jgi:hypothetical protein